MIEKIVQFVKDRPALKVSAIEKEAGLWKNALANMINGAPGRSFPDKLIWPLCETLCRYGLEIDGWRFVYNSEIHSFFIEKPIDKEPEIIEHNGEKGGVWFEYRVSVNRELLSDEFELLDFLKC